MSDELADLIYMHTLQGDTARLYDAAGQCTCGELFYEEGGNPVAHLDACNRILQAHAYHLADVIRRPRMRVHKEDGVNWVAEDACERTWCDSWESAMQAAYGHVCWGHDV